MPRGRPPICPYCGSNRNTRKGYRRTKGLGVRRIRHCKNCNRKFTPKNQKPVGATETTETENTQA